MIVFIFFSALMLTILALAVYENFKIPVTLKYLLITLLYIIIIIALIYILFIGACYLVSFNVSRETFLEMVRYYPNQL